MIKKPPNPILSYDDNENPAKNISLSFNSRLLMRSKVESLHEIQLEIFSCYEFKSASETSATDLDSRRYKTLRWILLVNQLSCI